jgi:hypothetical protein
VEPDSCRLAPQITTTSQQDFPASRRRRDCQQIAVTIILLLTLESNGQRFPVYSCFRTAEGFSGQPESIWSLLKSQDWRRWVDWPGGVFDRRLEVPIAGASSVTKTGDSMAINTTYDIAVRRFARIMNVAASTRTSANKDFDE